MEAEFLIPLLRNNAFIGHGCDIQDTFCKQPNVFILEQNPVIWRFNVQTAVITAGCAMSFHRPDVLVLKQNALILRSGIVQINGILYLLDAFENVCRVCRIALFGFKLRPCGAFLSFINRELAALVSAAHGYDL